MPTPYAHDASPITPARRVSVAVLSDTVDLANSGCVRADAAGTVVFIPEQNADAETVTMTLAAGEVIPIRVRRILATGTTIAAADLHVLAY
jgi:hypothetical protein